MHLRLCSLYTHTHSVYNLIIWRARSRIIYSVFSSAIFIYTKDLYDDDDAIWAQTQDGIGGAVIVPHACALSPYIHAYRPHNKWAENLSGLCCRRAWFFSIFICILSIVVARELNIMRILFECTAHRKKMQYFF